MNKRLISACICLLAMLLLVLPASAQGETTITAQGVGTVSAEPDIVTVQVNVSAFAPTMLEAQQQISSMVEKATAGMFALGVRTEDVMTNSYGVYPEYNYEMTPPELAGYRANHTLEITCRDVAMLDGVITALTDGGATEIYNVNYDVGDQRALYAKALELAVQAAQEKALTLASASGKTVTGLVSLTESQSYDMRYALSANAKDAAIATGIRSGSISVSASVTAVYTAE